MDATPAAPRFQFGDLTLVPDEHLLLRAGQPISLPPKAFDLLLVLAQNPGRLLTKEQLMQAVWADTAVEESNLSYHVFTIRKALGDTSENLIETVPKRGYRFTANVTRLSPPDEPASATGDAPLRARGGWKPALWFGAGLLCAIGGALIVDAARTGTAPAPIRAEVSPGVQLSAASPFALSPNGQQLVFEGRGSDGVMRLWIRRMDDDTPRPLSGTATQLGGLTPPMFWSPDSETVAFDAAGQLKGYDVRSGAVRTLCGPLSGLAVGGSWSADGILIVGHPSGGLQRCSLADGRLSKLTHLDEKHGETAHVFPWFLPDGRHFLYLRVARNVSESSGVYIGSLDDPPEAARPPRLLASGFGAAYFRAKGGTAGHVVYLRDATLFVQAFDEGTLRLRGDPVAITGPVGSFLDGGFFAVSHNDVVVLRPPDKDVQLTWFDQQGRRLGAVGEVDRYSGVALSPDGSQIAIAKEIVGDTVDQDIWTLHAARSTMTRVTFRPALEDVPVWSADGRRLMFTIDGDIGALFEQAADGSPNPRTLLERTSAKHKIPTSASPDGRYLLYTLLNLDRSRADVWVLPLTASGSGPTFPLIQREFDQDQARFSPDGRWVAYASNESGRYEILVRRFVSPDAPSSDARTIAVSTSGGTAPRWRADGGELYFIAPDGTVMAAEARIGAELSMSAPRELFRLASALADWDVAADGSRFLVAVPTGTGASAPFIVLWNHLARLSER